MHKHNAYENWPASMKNTAFGHKIDSKYIKICRYLHKMNVFGVLKEIVLAE